MHSNEVVVQRSGTFGGMGLTQEGWPARSRPSSLLDEGRLEYTAIRSVVNLAARLCASAADGEILVDEATATAVADRRPVASCGNRPIKGYDEDLPVFRIVRNEQMRTTDVP